MNGVYEVKWLTDLPVPPQQKLFDHPFVLLSLDFLEPFHYLLIQLTGVKYSIDNCP